MSDIDEYKALGLSEGEIAALEDRDDQPDAIEIDERVSTQEPTGELDYSALQQMAAATIHPDAVADHLRQLSAQRAELERAYDEGESELTFAEYKARMRELDDATMSATSSLAESRLVHRMATESAGKEWQRQIREARSEAKRMGLDMDRNPEYAQQWDRAVKFLGNDPENADKDMQWFLQEALKMVAVRNNRIKPERDFAPRTDTRQSPGVFDDDRHLAGLKGMDLERALARMTPEQAEAWLQSA